MRQAIYQTFRPKKNKAVGIAPPLDLISATAIFAYGLRRLSSTYAGPAIGVDNGDGIVRPVGFAANGDLDLAALQLIANASAAQTVVRVLYNQSGTGSNLSALSANSPIIATGNTINIRNSKPSLSSSSSRYFQYSGSLSPVGGAGLAAVFSQLQGSPSGLHRISGEGSGNHHSWVDATAYEGFFSTRQSFPGYQQTPQLAQHISSHSGTALSIYKDGLQIGSSSLCTFISGINSPLIPDPLFGGVDLSEIILINGEMSNSDRLIISANQKNHYSTP
jgi:hypothetical protein